MLFKHREVVFDIPKVMGIINVTPDSFSDGGKYNDIDKAVKQAEHMVELGATFVDIGGESTRPGAADVSISEELDRVVPVIEKISNELDVIISVDTSKPEVMRESVNAGATFINDIRALSMPGALETAAEFAQSQNIPTCIMHMQGTPQTMQNKPSYANVIEEVSAFFSTQIHRLVEAGFTNKQIILDPGFGFGKTVEHNYSMLKHFAHFKQFNVPVLAGMSRKSMIGAVLDKDPDSRLSGDIACGTIAALHGASILRVHDVEQALDAVKIVTKINTVN